MTLAGAPLFEHSTRELARLGMEQASSHADAVEERWTDRAFDLLKLYAESHMMFMTEEVRVWAHGEKGLPQPPDKRAWGAVTNRAVKQRILICDHYRPTTIPPAHATPRPVWRSQIYGGIDL